MKKIYILIETTYDEKEIVGAYLNKEDGLIAEAQMRTNNLRLYKQYSLEEVAIAEPPLIKEGYELIEGVVGVLRKDNKVEVRHQRLYVPTNFRFKVKQDSKYKVNLYIARDEVTLKKELKALKESNI